MGNRKQHCRLISKSAPEVAQTTGISLKLDLITGFMNQALSIQRSKAWGIIFPLIGDIGQYTDIGTDTGGTGTDTGGGGTVF